MTDRPAKTIDRWRYAGEASRLVDSDPGGSDASVARAWLLWGGVFVPVLLAAIAYIALRPPSVDLAAQLFRTELFASHGFLAWNNYWYSGHYLLGYSLLFPPLGAAVGATVVGGLAAVAATVLFGLLAGRHYSSGARLATLWFGAGTIAMLLSGRLTFALGVAIGLAALVALDRDRPLLAMPLALATSCASPVAGFFVALIGAALFLVGDRRRGAALAACAAAPVAVMAIAFPGAGREPFVLSSLLGALAVTLLVYLVLPRQERLLRRATALYGAAVFCAFAIPNAMGGNVVRLGNLVAGPLVVLALATRPQRRWLLVALAIPLLYLQWQGAVRDVSRASADPSVQRGFYTPLLAELKARTGGEPVRIEIPPTRDRWESYYVSPEFSLARGWERQAETDELQLFRTGLSPRSYRKWLLANGVSYVAIPDVPLDYLAHREELLIDRTLPYLRPIWANGNWRLFAVRDATGLVDRPARLTSIGADWFDLRVPRASRFELRIHFSPYWSVSGAGACLQERGPWTLVDARGPGSIHVGTDLSASALLGRHRVCADSR
ncbi:MAG TPA: hypothetical protein VGO36_04660 [Solirubrobacterales bacterium]|nr:hypothetical protein [Solirubrobacterales bacterium]